jgi:hypothetical protein
MTHHAQEVVAFRESSALKQAARDDRRARVLKYLRDPSTSAELCARFGATGIKSWLADWVKDGVVEMGGTPGRPVYRAMQPGEVAKPYAPPEVPAKLGTMVRVGEPYETPDGRTQVPLVCESCGHKTSMRLASYRVRGNSPCRKCNIRKHGHISGGQRATLEPYPRWKK